MVTQVPESTLIKLDDWTFQMVVSDPGLGC